MNQYLGGQTIVYTEDGIKEIQNLKIGDFIYDENCQLKQIVNIIQIKDEATNLTIKGGINIVCSKNNLFYDSETNTEIEAINSKQVKLKYGKSVETNIEYIDFINYMNLRKINVPGSRGGKVVSDNKIKLSHLSPIVNRYIMIDKDLMYLYGWIVAEGDKGSVTLHINEKDVAYAIIEKYLKVLGIDECKNKIFYERLDKNCIQVCIPYRTIYEKLFFKGLSVGYGARNKNISFLFKLDKDLVKSALQSMFQGDGCITNISKYRNLNYKTSSKTLAYQLQCLLLVKFGIHSYMYHGVNKSRKIDNRVLKETDYYNISIKLDKDIEFLTDAKNKDIKISEKPTKCLVKEINEIGVQDLYGIILEDDSTHTYLINGGIVTHDCYHIR